MVAMAFLSSLIQSKKQEMLEYARGKYGCQLTEKAGNNGGGRMMHELELNGVETGLFFGDHIICFHVGCASLLREARGACLDLGGGRIVVHKGVDLAGRPVKPFLVSVDGDGVACIMAKRARSVQQVEALLRMSLVLAIGW